MVQETADNKTCLMVVTGMFNSGGGIASVNRLVIRSLIERGYRVDVLALSEQQAFVPDYAKLQTRYQVFHGSKPAFAQALWRAQSARTHALYLCDHINLAAAFAPLRLLFKTPYVVWVYGIEVFPPKPSWEGKIGLNLAAKRISISTFTRDVVIEHAPSLAVVTCDLALEPDRWGLELPAAIPQQSSAPCQLVALDGQQRVLGTKVVLLVGRMESRERDKGHGVLLRAFSRILAEHPTAQLVLAGSGNHFSELEALGHTLAATDQQAIFMPGFVSEEVLTQLYSRCAIFAMPSKGEGFGIVYLEAMRFAKPCIGSRIDGASCVIMDGETGFLISDPDSEEEIASRINWLLGHPQAAADMGKAAYHRVRQHNMFGDFRQRLFDILDS